MTEEATHDKESSAEEIATASKQGWKDDPEHPQYKTAKQFLDDGKRIATIAGHTNKKLTGEIASMKQEFAELRQDLFKERHAGEVAGYQKAVQELNRRKDAAFKAEDIDELAVIDQEAQHLERPKPTKQAATQQPANVEFIERNSKNPWYSDKANPDHMDMTAYADGLIPQIKPTVTSNAALFSEIDRRVKVRFPEQFGEKKQVAAVETDGGAPPRKTCKKDWASLPKEIKADAEGGDYVKKYFKGDKEKYAASYYAEFGE